MIETWDPDKIDGQVERQEEIIYDDEFRWVDYFHYTSVNNRTEAELIQFDNQGEFVDILPEPFHGSFDTFVLYETVALVSSPFLQKLFNEVEKYGIRRLIFNRCTFSENLDDVQLPSCVKEVVFNNCRNLQEVVKNFLLPKQGKEYGLRTLVLKGVKYLIPLLGSIYFNLHQCNNYIRKLKFICCKPPGDISYKDINYFNWLEVIFKRNEKGYTSCKQLSKILLGIKKYRVSPLLNDLDLNVVKLVVNMIWKTRYDTVWHDQAYKK